MPVPIASIAPGGEAAVVLQLDPPADLTFGAYTGSLVLRSPLVVLGVSFRFVAVSDGIGDLKVRVTDEFTYYAAGEPPVVGAQVSLRDYITNALVATGFSDAGGEVLFENLSEAYYKVEATADEHGVFRTTVLVAAEQVTKLEAFLPRELVSYTWTVVPTEFEDEYTITIIAEYQTNVPAPVVVLEPSSVNLEELALPAQINFTVTNYGLVTAQDVQFNVVGNDLYTLIPLVTEIGDLPGGCTTADPYGPCRVTIPVLVIPTGSREVYNCDPIYVQECHELVCGPETYTYCSSVPMYTRYCPPTPGGGGVIVGGGEGGGGGPAFVPAGVPTQPVPCDPCAIKCATSALGCIPGVGCPLGLAQCGVSMAGSQSARQVIGNLFGCAGALLNCGIELTVVGDILSCACSLLRDCVADCTDPITSSIPCSPGDILGTIGGWISGSKSRVRTGDPLHDYYEQMYYNAHGIFAMMAHIYGDPVWIIELGPAELENYLGWTAAFNAVVLETSDAAEDISDAERQTLLGGPYPSFLTEEHVNVFINRWNLSLEYWDLGILSEEDLPQGWNPDFIDYAKLTRMHDYLVAAEQEIVAQGFEHPMEAFVYAKEVLVTDRIEEGEGVCATVRIRIDQTATMTRSAFRATLELENNGVDPLEAVSVEVVIKDADGEVATDRFGIFPPELSGISDVSGAGSVPGGAVASASWTILPTDEAAPLEPQEYFVSGTLAYELAGEVVTIPLYPVRIDVLPNPNLELKYFLETVVYSDDPFTPEIEPAVPFSLGLMVKNSGAGVAGNMRITSAQPQIIENDKGLIIDFDIIGTQVGLDEISPSLSVVLGDIGPGVVSVARWLMICTLQGEFVSYEASFEHVNSLGDPRLSLIESVDIFGLNHVVLADEPESDGLPDFLTNDFPDLLDLPDRVHLSDGTVEPVEADLAAGVTPDPQNLTAELGTTMPSGWAYIRIDDPFDAQYRLASVTRADGKAIMLEYNAWQTDRINRLVTGSPVERYVHLFDRGGSGHYTLTFDPDGTPPRVVAWHSVIDHGLEVGEVALEIDPAVSASEPRAAGVSKLVVTFSESIAASTFNEVNVFVDGFDLAGQGIDLSGVTRTITLRVGDTVGEILFSPPLPTNARYCVALIDVTDRSGNPLVGDGSRIDLTSLPGDATGDRRVNNTDVGGAGSLLGTDPISRDELYQVRSDIDCNGRIDQDDIDAILAARGTDARFLPNPCQAQRMKTTIDRAEAGNEISPVNMTEQIGESVEPAVGRVPPATDEL